MTANPFVRKLVELQKEADDVHEEFLRTNERAKELKKSWEAKVHEIGQQLKDYAKDMPLFPSDEDGDDSDSGGGGWGGGGDDGPSGPVVPAPGGGGDVIDVEFAASQPQLPAPARGVPFEAMTSSDAWRDVPISNLIEYGLGEKTVGLMDEAAIRTIGSLADWNRETNRLTDIPGIGEARATEIEEVMDKFWVDWSGRDEPKSGGDLFTSRPGARKDGEDKPKRKPREKKAS